MQTRPTQARLEHFEEINDQLRLAKSLSEEGGHGCLGNAVHHAKSDKRIKGPSIIVPK
jgi:hypothetical protein